MPDGPKQTNRSPAVEISNAAVQLVREYTGRGPTKAKTTITEDLIVVVMRDTMLKAEKTLVDHGEEALVITTRRRFQAAMRVDFIDIVERISARRVAAFMSDNHVDPDLAVEIFVLENDARPADES